MFIFSIFDFIFKIGLNFAFNCRTSSHNYNYMEFEKVWNFYFVF